VLSLADIEKIDWRAVSASELTDTQGAIRILANRFKRDDYSEDSLHQLVKHGRLRAFMFQDGELRERNPDEKTRGKDLLFLYRDLVALPEPQRGRPKTKKTE
jgi:hypothetical protein